MASWFWQKKKSNNQKNSVPPLNTNGIEIDQKELRC